MNDGKKISPIGTPIPTRETKNNSNGIINHDSENINTILEKLTELLQMTRVGCNIEGIVKENEYAVIVYKNGRKKKVNIDGDSVICAIYDIIIKLT